MSTDVTYLVCNDIQMITAAHPPGEPLPCVDCGGVLWRSFSSPTTATVVCIACAAERRRQAGEAAVSLVSDEARAELRGRGWTDEEIDAANAAADDYLRKVGYRQDN